ncbi:MAG: prenyltransferase/squalene oxidase repeat-containing protein [Planctomycetaceae bacterium]
MNQKRRSDLHAESQTRTPSASPDEFAARLRGQAQEALTASVHHASLSQQYLALSQKFAALAEQAGRGKILNGQVDVAARLVAEANTGLPAPPIGIEQTAVCREPESRKNAPGPLETKTLVQPDTPSVGLEQLPTDGIEQRSARSTQLPKRSRRKPKRVRELAEQIRLMAPQLMDRIRIRAKKSDLKPRQRTAVEEIRKTQGSAFASLALLLVTIVALSCLRLTVDAEEQPLPIIASFAEEVVESDAEPQPIEPPEEETGEQQMAEAEEPEAEESEPEPEEEMAEEAEPVETPEPLVPEEATSEPEMPVDPDSNSADLPMTDTAEESTTLATATAESSAEASSAVDNRSEAGRKMMLQKYGGSAASESAVGHALEWIASCQRRDGSWDFIDIGPCTNPGTVNNPIGGTAYALLPFLAAGHTHRDKNSRYRRQVEAGLNYLSSVGIRTPAGYDLRGVLNKGDKDDQPNEAYYVHGAATLAVCEAYGMTNDRRLKPVAEGAVLFLLNSQDPRGGGWRYVPQQAGSTSVTAIQVMALMAAKKAGIKVPEASLQKIMHYLDTVQVDGEGRYGYEVEKKSYQASITAMALLCRMYLGWRRADGDMKDGIALLDKRGPYDNLYYNYFATQVMRNWGGEEWNRWNERLRDDLIAWQITEGEAKGSWSPRDRSDYSKSGGRLLTTCLATLTLQVYYRYHPVFPDTDTVHTDTVHQ